MLESMGIAAQKAAWQLAESSSAAKNKLLLALAAKLAENTQFILEANAKDIAIAQENGMSTALLDRLVLNEQRLASIIADVRHVASLKDPVGELIDGSILDNGLDIKRRRVPLGVIGVIYEARPNVTIDIAALCLKTGNAVILRGGKETMHSNKALVEIIQQVLLAFSLPAATVQFIDNPDRALVTALLRLDKYVDMIIPRGGAALQRLCREQATIPVIIGGIGVCHIFVDKSANLDKALEIIINAKTQRPSTCNSVETLLIHQDLAPDFLAILGQHLAAHGVTIHIEAELAKLYAPAFAEASYLESVNYDEEWLSLDLNLKVVSGLDAAIAHIREHGTGHSEAILTTDMLNADLFVRRVDAAALYVNASTRFTDGAQFGLGAEVAVSTQKLHARGPMGLEALTTYKWIAYGDNLIRS